MTKDFRITNMEKSIRNRIAYLEELWLHKNKNPEKDENCNLKAEIRGQYEKLELLKKADTPQEQKAKSIELPAGWWSTSNKKNSRPFYLPGTETLAQWKMEAREAKTSEGDRNDHPRRTLVLLDAIDALMGTLAELGVNLQLTEKEAAYEETSATVTPAPTNVATDKPEV